DGTLRLGQSNSLRFQYLVSDTSYPTDVADDFEQIDSEIQGQAYSASFNRNTGEWFMRASASGYSPEFRADSGFITQADMRRYQGNLGRVFTGGADRWFSRIEVSAGADRMTDYDG